MPYLHFVYSKFCLVGMVCVVGIEYLTSHVLMAVIHRFFQMFLSLLYFYLGGDRQVTPENGNC